MKEVRENRIKLFQGLFAKTYDACPEAYLDGVMGRGYVNHKSSPSIGAIQLGEYIYFDHKKEQTKADVESFVKEILKKYKEQPIICVPFTELLKEIMSEQKEFESVVRYAMKKQMEIDKKKVSVYYNSLSSPYCYKEIDEDLFWRVQEEPWSFDFTGNYESYEQFKKDGFGILIMENDQIVAGASTFSMSKKTAELTLATNIDYRGQGMATRVAAAFVLKALEKNLYPNWDAANQTSVSVAKKLGYEFQEEYISYKRK